MVLKTRKFFAFAIILLVLTLPLASTAKAGGTIYIYYAGSSNSQVRKALNRMRLLTFVDDPANAEVFVLNGIIPDNRIIAQQIQSGASGLVLFLGPDIKPEQIQMLLGNRDTIKFIQTNNPTSLRTIGNADPYIMNWINSLVNNIGEAATAPEIKDRYIVSGLKFTPVIETSVDHSLILGYTPTFDSFGNASHFIFIFTPFLDNQNEQFQNWEYFDYFVNILVSISSGLGVVGTYSEFNTYFPAPTPTPSYVSKTTYIPIAIAGFFFIILIVGIALLWRRKKRSSNSDNT